MISIVEILNHVIVENRMLLETATVPFLASAVSLDKDDTGPALC
jgi:hypothetical protein